MEEFISNINILTRLLDKISTEHDDSLEQEVLSICRVQVRLNEAFNLEQQEWLEDLIIMSLLKEPQYYLAAIEVMGEAL